MIKVKLYNCSGKAEYREQENPLSLGYLKTNCRANIEIVKNKEDLKDCDLIGLTAFTAAAQESIDILNSTNIPVIIGGHITQWEGLSDYNFKHIVKGEGEIAFQSIVDGRETDQIISKPLIENLDTLNFPDRGKITKYIQMKPHMGFGRRNIYE